MLAIITRTQSLLDTRSTWFRVALLVGICWVAQTGCRRRIPIHVWQPAQVETGPHTKIALAPVAGDSELARRFEDALMAQRPSASADVALFTSEQLLARSPVRLASTSALNNDSIAIEAAKAVGATVLLQGEVVTSDMDLSGTERPQPSKVDYNNLFFAKRNQGDSKQEKLLISWRVVDVDSSKTIGTHVTSLRTEEARQQYPDLDALSQDDTDLLISASARETWKAVSPIVVQDEVKLAVPYFQLGSWSVRRGVRAAKRGDWQAAEKHWQRTADIFWFNAAAQHNLAIAMAAREDFSNAKLQLQKATGPLAFRLPHESLFWLDSHHRAYYQAHGLPKPSEGWAFPDPEDSPPLTPAPPIELDALPWWTAIPFAKPPGWTWVDWLTQPWVY